MKLQNSDSSTRIQILGTGNFTREIQKDFSRVQGRFHAAGSSDFPHTIYENSQTLTLKVYRKIPKFIVEILRKLRSSTVRILAEVVPQIFLQRPNIFTRLAPFRFQITDHFHANLDFEGKWAFSIDFGCYITYNIHFINSVFKSTVRAPLVQISVSFQAPFALIFSIVIWVYGIFRTMGYLV
ncbi:receptor kinase [Dorcoceras hygrometricum]|uniref:Receptor kinase n=1 Tax=Dorcoceras hygrometricum TaxID=472368 RepID=A0A2Z7ANU1_9LAMI|nr:receptor kinase [Dorcoceras hygrometricum]